MPVFERIARIVDPEGAFDVDGQRKIDFVRRIDFEVQDLLQVAGRAKVDLLLPLFVCGCLFGLFPVTLGFAVEFRPCAFTHKNVRDVGLFLLVEGVEIGRHSRAESEIEGLR